MDQVQVRHRVSVAVGWALAVAVAAASVSLAWHVHAQDHAAARAEAENASDLLVQRIRSQVNGRAVALRASAEALLATGVDDGSLAQALVPIDVPYALVIEVASSEVVAAVPPRELDGAELLAQHPHLAAAARGRVGVGNALESETGEVGTAVAVPFTTADGREHLLSTVFWLASSEIGQAVDDAAGLAPGTTWVLSDRSGGRLASAGVPSTDEVHGDLRQVAPVAELPWTLTMVGPASAFDGGLASSHRLALFLGVLATGGALVLGAVWHRHVRSTARVEAMHAHLRAVHAQQQEFVAVASHELRTPITVVTGFATTLQSRWYDLSEPERRMIVDRLAGAAGRMSGLVEDLMVVTLSERGEIHLSPVEVSASAFVNAAISSSRLASTPVQVDVPPGLRVRVDATYGPRMLANLLDNAEKYGEAPYRIVASEADDHVEIRVHDAGGGVPAAFVPHLFTPFRQAESHQRRRNGGIGLGLHAVSMLAERSGGWVAYEPGDGGATFVLALLRAVAPDRPSAVPQTA